MKSWPVLIAVLSLALGFSAAAQESESVRWEHNLTAATQLAKATGKPMLVVFR